MIKSYALYFTARTSAGICFFLSTVILINIIPVATYAEYSLALSTAQSISFAFCSWVGLSAALKIPGGREDHSQLVLAQHSQLSIVTSFFSAVLVSAFFVFGIVEMPSNIAVACVLFCFAVGLHETQLQVLNARQMARDHSISTLIRYTGGLVGIVLVALLSADPDGSSPIFIMTGATALALIYPAIYGQILAAGRVSVASMGSMAGTYFVAGFASLVIFGLWTFVNYANRLVLHWTASAAELGSFAAVTDLLNGPVVLIFQIFNLAFGPVIVAAAKRHDDEEFRLRTGQYLGIFCFAAATICCVLWLSGPGFVLMLNGKSDGGASGQIVGWVVMSSALSCCFGAAGLIMMVMQYKRLAVALTASTLLLNIAAIWGSESAHQVARSSAMSLGMGTAAIWVAMLGLCHLRIPLSYFMASAVSVSMIAFCSWAIGLDFYANHEILGALIGIGISSIVAACFNLLDARSAAIRIIRSIFNKP